MKPTRSASCLAIAVTLGAFSMSGCSAVSADAAVCGVLTSDTQTAASLFTMVIPQMTSEEQVAARIELMEKVEEPPAALTEEWAQWRGYLDLAEQNLESDPLVVILGYSDVEDAADALVDFYTDVCL